MLGLMVPILCQWQDQDVHLVEVNTIGTQDLVIKTQKMSGTQTKCRTPLVCPELMIVILKHSSVQRQIQLMTME